MPYDLENSFTIASDGSQMGQNVTADAASTNLIDLIGASTPTRIALTGSNLPFLIMKALTASDVTTSFEIILQNDADSAFGSAIDVKTWNIALADCDADGDLMINEQIPAGKYERYLRLYFNAIGGDATVGEIEAYLATGAEPAENVVDNIAL